MGQLFLINNINVGFLQIMQNVWSVKNRSIFLNQNPLYHQYTIGKEILYKFHDSNFLNKEESINLSWWILNLATEHLQSIFLM